MSFGRRRSGPIKAYTDVPNCTQVLPHTFAVKDMVALGFDGILGNVVAEPADGGFPEFVAAKECVAVALATENQVGVASHLAHTGESRRHVTTQRVKAGDCILTS